MVVWVCYLCLCCLILGCLRVWVVLLVGFLFKGLFGFVSLLCVVMFVAVEVFVSLIVLIVFWFIMCLFSYLFVTDVVDLTFVSDHLIDLIYLDCCFWLLICYVFGCWYC